MAGLHLHSQVCLLNFTLNEFIALFHLGLLPKRISADGQLVMSAGASIRQHFVIIYVKRNVNYFAYK